MPLSKIVVKMYAVLIEIALWLVALIALVAGWQANGFFGAIGSLVGASILAAVFFGAFLVLNDIRNRVQAIEQKVNSSASSI